MIQVLNKITDKILSILYPNKYNRLKLSRTKIVDADTKVIRKRKSRKANKAAKYSRRLNRRMQCKVMESKI